MAQILDLGKLRFNWAGEYNPATEYEYNDIVKYGANVYAYTYTTTSTGVLPTDESKWTLAIEGIRYRGVYTTGTSYLVNDLVTDAYSTYLVNEAHTAVDGTDTDVDELTVIAVGQGELPAQGSQSGKLLSTDGNNPEWVDSIEVTNVYVGEGKGSEAVAFETSAELTDTVGVFAGSSESFVQMALVNTDDAEASSTDFIAYTADGTNDSGWIDMGITGREFEAAEFGVTGAHDGYLFMSAPRVDVSSLVEFVVVNDVATITTAEAHNYAIGDTVDVSGASEDLDGRWEVTAVPTPTRFSYVVPELDDVEITELDPAGTAYSPKGTGNLVIATDDTGLENKIVIAAGGFASGTTQLTITPDENVHIEIATASTSPTSGAVTVVGGVGVQGDINVAGDIIVAGELNLQDLVTQADISSGGDLSLSGRSVNIVNWQLSSNIVTVTTATPHLFDLGDTAVITGLGSMANGTKVIATIPSPTSFTYSTSGTDTALTTVTGAVARVSAHLNVSEGKATIAKGVEVGQTLDVEGWATFNSRVYVTGNLEVSGDASFNHEATFKGDVSITSHTHPVLSASAEAGLATLEIDATGFDLGLGFDAGDDVIVQGVGEEFDTLEEVTIISATNNGTVITYAIEDTSTIEEFSPEEGEVLLRGDLSVAHNISVVGGATFGNTVEISGGLSATGKLYVGDGAEEFETEAELTNPEAVFEVTGGPYAQVAIHGTTPDASTDLIVYADNGDDLSGWIDMGITGSDFEQAEFGITGPNDGYIFFEAPEGTTGAGNLVLATGDKGSDNKIIFAAGGFADGTTQMEITPGENVHIEIDTASTSPSSGALTVVGGVGVQGDMNVQGNVSVEGTITFGGEGTTVETSNLAVTDPMVYVGTNNPDDIVDLSFVGEYAPAVATPQAFDTVSASKTSGEVTLVFETIEEPTASPTVGSWVTVATGNAAFDGTFKVTEYTAATAPADSSLKYAFAGTNVGSTAVGSGTVTVVKRARYAGIARDASDGIVKVFQGATTKPVTAVDFAEVGVSMAPLMSGAVTSTGAVTATSIVSTSSEVASTFAGPLNVSGAAEFSAGVTLLGDVTITGRLDVQEIREDVLDATITSNVLTADYALGNIFYISTAPAANFTLNLTNAPTENGKTLSVTAVVTQGATGYIPNAFQIGGSASTIRWGNGTTPTATNGVGKIDIFNFTLIRRASAWVVLGAANLNY
jgi:hypothetical protein